MHVSGSRFVLHGNAIAARSLNLIDEDGCPCMSAVVQLLLLGELTLCLPDHVLSRMNASDRSLVGHLVLSTTLNLELELPESSDFSTATGLNALGLLILALILADQGLGTI